MKLLQRFFNKIETADHNDDECWYWMSSINKKGYGNFWINGTSKIAHRISYELFRGKIPQNLQVDHLCRNRRCVNPQHLELVTLQENVKRGNSGINMSSRTHCPKGHEYNKENTFTNLNGSRVCKTCYRKPMKSSKKIKRNLLDSHN